MQRAVRGARALSGQASGGLFRELAKEGIAILLAEQNLRFALEIADRGYVIEKGQIRHQGRVAALREEEIVAQHLAV